jgi:hypothetical protein
MEHKEPPPLVMVVWEDAQCLDSTPWVEMPETPVTYKPMLITTVGFLLHQSDEGLIITGSWHPDQTAPRDQVPRGMVREVKFLEPVKPKRGKR